jgi:hypothetical protein
MPGNIRKAEHFIAFLRRFIEYLKVRYYDHNLSHNLMSDSNESLACCGGDTPVIPRASQRNHFHREATS